MNKLDTALKSLKSYWDNENNKNNKNQLDSAEVSRLQPISDECLSEYELEKTKTIAGLFLYKPRIIHHGKLEHHEQLIQIAEDNITVNKYKLEELKTALPTEKEFYELINLHLLDLLQMNDITKLDAICNELVTNLRAGNDSIPVIKLNPPYGLLVDLAEISTGRPSDLTLELNHIIIATRKYKRFNNQLRDLLEMPERDKPEQPVML